MNNESISSAQSMPDNYVGDIQKDLRKSTMKCCTDCVIAGMAITDYDVSVMKKTSQNWKCPRHYKSWVEKRRNASRRSESTTAKAIAK